MAVTDSRIKAGSLTFKSRDATPVSVVFSCQPTTSTLTPTQQTEGDPVQVLCGDQLPAASTTTWTLDLTTIQDWTNLEGFVNWAFDHDQEIWDFELLFDVATVSPMWKGSVTVSAVPIGGQAGTRLTSDSSWPLLSKPTRTPPTAPGATAATSDKAA
jgi:hypothetical protein